MPYYADLNDLPRDVQELLPPLAQIIYIDTFNAAWEENINTDMYWFDRENTARQEAWAAVEKVFQKDTRTGQWRRRGYRIPDRISDGNEARPG